MMDKNLFRIPKIRPVLMGLAGLAVLQAFLIIGQAYFLAHAITNVWNKAPVLNQLHWVLGFFVCFMGRQFCHTVREWLLDRFAYTASQQLREQLLTKIYALGPNFVQKVGTGNMVTMAIEGIRQIENYFTLILPKMVNMMIIPWLVAAFLFFYDMEAVAILLIVFPIIILFMIILGYAAQAKADRQYARYQQLSNHFLDSLRGLQTLRYLGLGKRYEKSVFTMSEDYRKATIDTLKIGILSTFALDFFTTISIAIIALMLGLKLIYGQLLLFPALLILILAPDFFLPVRDFSNDYHATLDGGNTVKAIFAILNEEGTAVADQYQANAGWSAEDRLQLTKVSMRYDPAATEATLKEIAFEWQGFGKIGIVGLSGSGKSTLIKLLAGFLSMEDTGTIQLNEQKLPHLKQVGWQEQLFYIPQSPYIFHASLHENIRFYVPEASEDEVLQAVAAAGLSEVIAELPEGLATEIGDGGHSLSGGQIQRIALARAFLDHSRKILLFDEPTAHLDIETEARLKETILPLLEDKLVFFATHRLHWMQQMDYILVMKDGAVVEQGTFDELQAKTAGPYQELVQAMKGEA